MAITDYHAQVLAYQLTNRSASTDVDKLAGALAGAQVHLNPHQIDAALFAFQNPLSQGVLLADEVGLGKTIEAGLVLSQLWAERERHILVITPATLRKQWYSELEEKFFLECVILESKTYNEAIRWGDRQPFNTDKVVICSYQFARTKAEDIRRVPWDIVVMDEAHFLRNVYKTSGNVVAKTIKDSLAGRRKLLLTATPLQNSLNELFGLVSMIDENVFGDIRSFSEQYIRLSREGSFEDLKQRLKPIAQRTLRRQVTAYVRYTDRKPVVHRFDPGDDEHELYNLVSEYLRRDNLKALPASQRHLMTLVLRKLLASSTFAIAATLEKMATRLQSELAGRSQGTDITIDLGEDFEGLEDLLEEEQIAKVSAEQLSESEQAAIRSEVADLRAFGSLARSVKRNAKGDALLVALEKAFDEKRRLNEPLKAIIFTESRKTQEYLYTLLESIPAYRDRVLLFNGSNSDAQSKQIYTEWQRAHQGSDRVTGSRSADMRSALVDSFRDHGKIMIATEAAAQGLNLQFCSLIINYDLPWNPQRIEQRIGRCHRYGQKHDVVVVNFLNTKNQADERVYELLRDKFNLFEGVFGASDEVLGAIGSGFDIERRIGEIYQNCRTTDQIDVGFQQLRLQLDEEIKQQMSRTRRQLLENFDEEVAEKLQGMDRQSRTSLNRIEHILMDLTRHELGEHARFDGNHAFNLWKNPTNNLKIPTGRYELPRRNPDAHIYRKGHDLADALIDRAKDRRLPLREVVFNYSAHETKISAIERLVGKCGWLSVAILALEAKDYAEDQLMVAAVTDAGDGVPDEDAVRFFALPGFLSPEMVSARPDYDRLCEQQDVVRQRIMTDAMNRSAELLEQEDEKLTKWADDRRLGLKTELREILAAIDEAEKQVKQARSAMDRLEIRRRINQLEADLDEKEAESRAASRQITKDRNELYFNIEERLKQQAQEQHRFTIRWSVI